MRLTGETLQASTSLPLGNTTKSERVEGLSSVVRSSGAQEMPPSREVERQSFALRPRGRKKPRSEPSLSCWMVGWLLPGVETISGCGRDGRAPRFR